MKVETPQILWNSEGDKGKNAPLYSIAMQESGIDHDSGNYSHVMVTAGNTNVINLWKISFDQKDRENDGATSHRTIFQKQALPSNQVAYMLSLTRHELPVNTVAFSPNGLHLVTAGEAGNIVMWSVPVAKRGGGNGRHFWATVTKEADLSVRVVSTHCEGVCDISWSADSKRFVAGTIDSQVLIYEDKSYDANQSSPETHQKDSEWQRVFRNGEHSAFVQGVAYDPLGVYIASMGSDRTVRVFSRKTPPKSKKKVLRPSNAPRTVSPPQDHHRLVSRLLTESKLEMGKTRRIQRRCIQLDENGAQIKQKLFVDESNCESFFRRLCWTADGMFLVTPAALWHPNPNDESVSFSTYLFARHRFDEPYKVFSGLEKPSVVVRPNPLLFQLPSSDLQASKENQSPNGSVGYRSIFAVLTLDSVLIYDTHHDKPLSVIRGLHYAGLTDCCWSRDGLNLTVCSTDGYISIINFGPDDLGEVYTPPVTLATTLETSAEENQSSNSDSEKAEESPITIVPLESLAPIPPCERGQSATLEEPPAKRLKKTRITPTLISSPPNAITQMTSSNVMSSTKTGSEVVSATKRTICAETESVGAAVFNLSLNGEQQPKKKKRIQPLLISS